MTAAKYYSKRLRRGDTHNLRPLNQTLKDCQTDLNLKKFYEEFDKVSDSKAQPAKSDYTMSKIIHQTIVDSGLKENFYGDMRFWQWLAFECDDYVKWRWGIDESNPKPTHIERFIGAGGQRGFSMNSFARLFGPALILLEHDGSGNLLKSFWKYQQTEQSISQCADTLNRDIFIGATLACTQINEATNEKIKSKIVKLNALKSSLFFDNLQPDEIVKILK